MGFGLPKRGFLNRPPARGCFAEWCGPDGLPSFGVFEFAGCSSPGVVAPCSMALRAIGEPVTNNISSATSDSRFVLAARTSRRNSSSPTDLRSSSAAPRSPSSALLARVRCSGVATRRGVCPAADRDFITTHPSRPFAGRSTPDTSSMCSRCSSAISGLSTSAVPNRYERRNATRIPRLGEQRGEASCRARTKPARIGARLPCKLGCVVVVSHGVMPERQEAGSAFVTTACSGLRRRPALWPAVPAISYQVPASAAARSGSMVSVTRERSAIIRCSSFGT